MNSDQRGFWRNNWFLVGFVAVVLSAVCITSLRSIHITDHLQGLVNNHLANMQPSQWLVTTSPTQTSPELQKICENQRNAFLGGVRAWGPAKALTNQFSTNIIQWVSSSWGWCVAQTNVVGNSISVLGTIPGKEMILLVPQEVTTKAPSPFFCYQEQHGRVIQIRAYKMPDQILVAFLLHSFGQADRSWLQKKPLTSREEVPVHELTAAVLDKYSNGEYLHAISNIVARANVGRPKPEYALWNLTPRDLDELNRIVGATGVGRDVARILVTHHLFTIGFVYLDQHNGTLEKKAAYYDWLSGVASGK